MRGIAILGNVGSGKTTLANALVAELTSPERRWERLSFSAPLKDELACMMAKTDWVSSKARVYRNAMDDPKTKDKYRPLQQAVGQFFRDNVDKDFWVNKLVTQMRLYPNRGYVVDDCRYPNEYEALKERGFRFVRIADGPTTRSVNGHESETFWRAFSAVDVPYATTALEVIRLLEAQDA